MTVSDDKTLRVWDLAKFKLKKVLYIWDFSCFWTKISHLQLSVIFVYFCISTVLLLSPLRLVLLPPTGTKDSFNFLVKPWTVNKQLFCRKWQCLKNSLHVNTNRFIDRLDGSNVRKIIVNGWLLNPWMFGSEVSSTYLPIRVVDNL